LLLNSGRSSAAKFSKSIVEYESFGEHFSSVYEVRVLAGASEPTDMFRVPN
jgi:hypothetical protein